MKPYLFDAFPLLCWLQEEPGWEMVDRLLKQAEENEARISIHIINVGEVFYRSCRLVGLKKAEKILLDLRLLPISFVPASEASVLEAARIKGQYPVSYADAFAIATARDLGAPVVTADPEYQSVSKLVEILWLR